jgi:hypothetical protein
LFFKNKNFASLVKKKKSAKPKQHLSIIGWLTKIGW